MGWENWFMVTVALVLCWLVYRAKVEFQELKKFIDALGEMISEDIETRRKNARFRNDG